MPDTPTKNKLLFDFYQNIKNDTEILTVEDLEIAIKTLELAKEELKNREQKRLREDTLKELKNKDNNSKFNGNVIYLPKKLKSLNPNAFKDNEKIVKVVINNGCTEIGEGAFEGCVNLREVVFPQNRILLRRRCFKDCTSLREISIPNIANICPGAFENCQSLQRVSLPSTLSNIYSKAFKNCRLLSDISFAEKRSSYWETVSVYPGAFENCISLEKLEIYKGRIDKKAFINCSNLRKIYNHYPWHDNIKFEKCDAKVVYL